MAYILSLDIGLIMSPYSYRSICIHTQHIHAHMTEYSYGLQIDATFDDTILTKLFD